MHLETQREELLNIINVIKVFKAKCKTKSDILYLSFEKDSSKIVYTSEEFFLRCKLSYIAEFQGLYGLNLCFVKNLVNIFNNEDIIEIDFRDKLVIAHQKGITLKDSTTTHSTFDDINVRDEDLEEIPLQLSLSNKLLSLNLEEIRLDVSDPFAHLYNVNQSNLFKMSSFCALRQTLEKTSQCNITLTQNILSICSIVSKDAKYYKHFNSFYIKDDNREIRMPLANIKFPNLTPILNAIQTNGQDYLIKTKDILDICDKCYALNIEKKKNRVDVVFKDGLLMYEYNGVLSGVVETELNLQWKTAFNPLLMRGVLSYINEESVLFCINFNNNNILIRNQDNTISFMLALCK